MVKYEEMKYKKNEFSGQGINLFNHFKSLFPAIQNLWL